MYGSISAGQRAAKFREYREYREQGKREKEEEEEEKKKKAKAKKKEQNSSQCNCSWYKRISRSHCNCIEVSDDNQCNAVNSLEKKEAGNC